MQIELWNLRSTTLIAIVEDLEVAIESPFVTQMTRARHILEYRRIIKDLQLRDLPIVKYKTYSLAQKNPNMKEFSEIVKEESPFQS